MNNLPGFRTGFYFPKESPVRFLSHGAITKGGNNDFLAVYYSYMKKLLIISGLLTKFIFYYPFNVCEK